MHRPPPREADWRRSSPVPMTADRSLIARLAAHESWADTADPSARTAPARRAHCWIASSARSTPTACSHPTSGHASRARSHGLLPPAGAAVGTGTTPAVEDVDGGPQGPEDRDEDPVLTPPTLGASHRPRSSGGPRPTARGRRRVRHTAERRPAVASSLSRPRRPLLGTPVRAGTAPGRGEGRQAEDVPSVSARSRSHPDEPVRRCTPSRAG